MATKRYVAGYQAGADYINASTSEIVIGPSTTQLFRNLSFALKPHLVPGSEIVCSAVDHEANIASWLAIAEDLGLTIKWWEPQTPSSRNPQLTPDTLRPLLTEKTRLVTCTHASNILGTITPVRELADLIHRECPNGLLCVDAVAYAPHRPIDVKALGVDIYAFSWYKVYGPHIAQLYVKQSVQDRSLRSLGHYFKGSLTLEDKLGLAGSSYELVAAIPHVKTYLESQGWDAIVFHEEIIQDVLLSYLRSKPNHYEICGVPEKDALSRVPVISFLVKGENGADIVAKVESQSEFGFKYGHFYSKRLCDNILKAPEEGVVRVSLVHYNTVEELRRFVKVLDAVVCGE